MLVIVFVVDAVMDVVMDVIVIIKEITIAVKVHARPNLLMRT